MTEIQQNRWDQLIRRVAGVVGGPSQVNDTLNELFPVIDVERVPGELLALMGTDICIGSSSLLGAAGETPKIQLFNPVGSGKIITLTQAIVFNDNVARIRFSTTNIQLSTTVATQVYRDRRNAITSRPTGTISQESSVGLGDAHGQVFVQVNIPYTLTDENSIVVLNPGSGFQLGPTVATSTMTVTFFWRERVAQASELRALSG